MTMQVKSRLPSAAANGRNGHSLISDDKFRQLYTLTLQLRGLAESEASAPWLRGSEAMLAAVAADLRAADALVCLPGLSLRHELPRGVVVTEMSRHDDGLTQVLSAAVAARLKKNGGVAVILKPSRDSLLREACALAVQAKLPVLFVEHDFADNTSPWNKGAETEGMPEIPVDAQDVVAIYRVAHESITRARAGSGPTRIQCVPWVAPPQTRKPSEAASTDAVAHLERWLTGRGLPADRWRREITAQLQRNTASPYQESQRSADPPVTNGSGGTTERTPQSLA